MFFIRFFGVVYFFFEGLMVVVREVYKSQMHLQPTKSGGFQDPAGTVFGSISEGDASKNNLKVLFLLVGLVPKRLFIKDIKWAPFYQGIHIHLQVVRQKPTTRPLEKKNSLGKIRES